jgi:hypothetical protein
VDAVAIVSILAAAVVSLTVAVLTITAESRRQRRRSQLERLNELRDVLDRGGGALTSALYAFDRRRVSGSPSESAETGPEFNNKVEDVEMMEARIDIRLGEKQPVARAYHDALECLQELRALVYKAGEDMTPEQDDRATDLRAQVVERRREYLEHARREVNPERDRQIRERVQR